MSYANLRVETRDGVAVVTVHRPEKLNALDDRTIEELDAAFDDLAADASVRGVILTGAGAKAFVAGADIARAVGRDARRGARPGAPRPAGLRPDRDASGSRSSPPSTASPSGAGASWRWRATCASRRRTPGSGRPR